MKMLRKLWRLAKVFSGLAKSVIAFERQLEEIAPLGVKQIKGPCDLSIGGVALGTCRSVEIVIPDEPKPPAFLWAELSQNEQNALLCQRAMRNRGR